MARTDIFLKVVVDHTNGETPEKIAGEICRQIEKLYVVRKAEMTNYITQSEGPTDE